jgi:N-acylneuraminate cytidylyltransferase
MLTKATLVIPAKGTSERIKNKNLYKVNGKSLIRLACEKALLCKNVYKVYLDTESDLIINQVLDLESNGLNIIKRPKELANNDIGANEMMMYALHSVSECDILMQTFATSPLITAETIDDCVHKFVERDDQNDSFFTVTEMQEYFWDENKPINFDHEKVPNSYDLEKIHMETHGLYGIRTKNLIKNKTRIGYSPIKYTIPKIECFDINETEDLKIIEKLMK